jgi:hypothetical protein
MTPEQQTPASVVAKLRRRATHYNDRGGRYSYIGDDVAVDDEAAALIERLSAEREGGDWKAEWEAVCAERIKDRERSQEIINERDRWIVELIRERDIARAALTQGESRQTGWQDIATAPTWQPAKDANIFLGRPEVLLFGRGQVFTGYWSPNRNGGGEWCALGGGCMFGKFTHWMPLPICPPESGK